MDRTTTTSPSSATASTSSAPRAARTCSPSVAGTGPRHPARQATSSPTSLSFAKLPPEVRAARARADAAEPDQGELAGDRPPAGLPRLRRREALRRGRRGDVGERRFLGLYTHTAYSASPWEIPLLRRKVESVLERSGLLPGSHDHKALIEILETYPRDELFQITNDELLEIALGILHLGERRRVAALRPPRRVRPLPLVPGLHPARAVQHREPAQDRGDPAGGVRGRERRLHDPHLRVGAGPPALRRLHRARRACPTTTWRRSRRASPRPPARGRTTSATRSSTMPATSAPSRCTSATATRSPAPTAKTSRRVQAVARPRPDRAPGVRRTTSASASTAPLGLDASTSSPSRSSAPAAPILLSDVLPLLENMGVRGQRRAAIRAAAARTRLGLDLRLRAPARSSAPSFDVEELRETLPACVRAGLGEAKPRTTASTASSSGRGLTAREITILRAIAKYLRQAGSTFSQAYMEDALAEHPDVARGLVELFVLRLDPARPADADEQARGARGSPASSSRRRRREPRRGPDPARLPQDGSGRCCGRTTSRRTGRARRSPISRSSSTRSGSRIFPQPRPMFEVYVYSTRVEGVHLRGGKVARGGIRWSDRQRGLPHRGPRPDEGADRQERRDRARWGRRAASS